MNLAGKRIGQIQPVTGSSTGGIIGIIWSELFILASQHLFTLIATTEAWFFSLELTLLPSLQGELWSPYLHPCASHSPYGDWSVKSMWSYGAMRCKETYPEISKEAVGLSGDTASSEDDMSQTRHHHVVRENEGNTVQGKAKQWQILMTLFNSCINWTFWNGAWASR